MAELNATQQAFVDRYAPYANLASQQLGLPSRVILAKLAVETGYGQHFANNNLPGLKTGNSAQNDGFGSVRTATWEDYGGSGRTNIKDGFIRYPTPEQSIGGLVPWLSNSTYMNSLADRRGGGIFDRDAAAEASAVQALGASGFSTDRNASAKVTDVLGKLPDLSSYGIAPSFTPAINQLMNFVPYDASGRPNFSDGLGGFTNNDYYSGTEFQSGGGIVLPRERGASGLELPSPQMGVPQESPGLLDTLANGASAVGRGLSGLFGGGTAEAANAPPLALPAEGTDGFGAPGYGPGNAFGYGDGSFGQGITPFGNVNRYAFAGGRDFSGGVGPGSLNPSLSPYGAPPDAYAFAGGFNPSQSVGPGAVGQLPAGFDEAAYKAANPDVAQAGLDARQHYLNFGAAEGRALAPPGWTQTQGAPGLSPTFGSGTPAPTYGPDGSVSVTSQGLVPTGTMGAPGLTGTYGAPQAVNGLPPDFDARSYLAANADLQALGFTPERAAQHYAEFGANEVRALAPGQEARVHAAPGLTPTYSPPPTTPSFAPGGGTSYLGMPSTPAPTLGAPDASSALPANFDPTAYINANADLKALGFTGDQARQHFLDFGQFETRALAPGQEARVYAPPGLTPTYGAPAATPTIDAPSLTPTIGAPGLTPTMGAPGLTPTYSPPPAIPSWSPFGGAGIGSPYGFSSGNFGGGLGATPQTFASFYPVGSGGSDPASAPSGPDMSNPFSFTNMDVSGFDPNALGGGGGGGSDGSSVDLNFGSGFDEAGAMRNVLAQQAEALRRADQAAKTPMHTDPNVFNAVLANGGNAVGFGTPLQNPGAIAAPVVPNLTLANLGAANAGMGGAMLGSGLNLSINSRPLAGGFGFGF